MENESGWQFGASAASCGVIKSAWHLFLGTRRSGIECQASTGPAERMLIEMPAGSVIKLLNIRVLHNHILVLRTSKTKSLF